MHANLPTRIDAAIGQTRAGADTTLIELLRECRAAALVGDKAGEYLAYTLQHRENIQWALCQVGDLSGFRVNNTKWEALVQLVQLAEAALAATDQG